MPYSEVDVRKAYHKNYYEKRKDKYIAEAKARKKSLRQNDPRKYMYQTTKSRAKQRGIDFTISEEDIVLSETCPVFGFKLRYGEGPQAFNSPSIDRIDNTKGYIPGNICVISHKANCMKRDNTLTDLHALIAYIERYK